MRWRDSGQVPGVCLRAAMESVREEVFMVVGLSNGAALFGGEEVSVFFGPGG
jgi:hypothetical protein